MRANLVGSPFGLVSGGILSAAVNLLAHEIQRLLSLSEAFE
jgi:hypothetical protein